MTSLAHVARLLLPPGRALSRREASGLGQLLEGMTLELERVDDLVKTVASDVVTDAQLDAWTAALALDPALSASARRARILALLVGHVDTSRSAYDEAAAAAGLVIVRVETYAPFEAGASRAGDLVRDDGWLHTFELVVGAIDGATELIPGSGTRAHGFVVGTGLGPWGSMSDADLLAATYYGPEYMVFEAVAVPYRYSSGAPVLELRATTTGAAGNLVAWNLRLSHLGGSPNGFSYIDARGSQLSFDDEGAPVFVEGPFVGGSDDIREAPPDRIAALQRIVDSELRRAHTLVRVKSA